MNARETVKHAGPEVLHSISTLLDGLRAVPGLTEHTPGVFYRKGQAFLHFHEDDAGLFVDIKVDGNWRRQAVVVAGDHSDLIGQVRSLIMD